MEKVLKLYIYRIPISDDYFLKNLVMSGINGIFIKPFFIVDKEILGLFNQNSENIRPFKLLEYGDFFVTEKETNLYPPYPDEVTYQFGQLGKIIGHSEEIIRIMKERGLLHYVNSD